MQQTLSNTLLNSFAVAATKNSIAAGPQNQGIARTALGLTYPEIYPSNRFGTGPDVTLTGFTAYNAGDYIRNRNLTFQFRDDLTKVAGPHALKFGTQITRSEKDQNTRPRENGVENYTEGEQDQEWRARFWQYEFYAQNNWRATPKLTLDIGVRYNIIAPLYSALNNFSTFDPGRFDPARAPGVVAADGSLVPGTGSPTNGIVIFGPRFPDDARGVIPAANDPAAAALFVGLPRGGVPTEYTNIGPRLGFSYNVFGRDRAAIRGGIGVFYDRVTISSAPRLPTRPSTGRRTFSTATSTTRRVGPRVRSRRISRGSATACRRRGSRRSTSGCSTRCWPAPSCM
jgi:hypothetical protein